METHSSKSEKRLHQKNWDAKHPEKIRSAKAKYNQKRPTWGFRPSSEILAWLEQERWDEQGEPESNAALLNRKLEKLKKLEEQGF